MANSTKLTKKELSAKLGVSVSSLYYRHKKPTVDLEVKNHIETVMTQNPAYGHKRIALALKLNKKRIRRVMKKFDLKPLRRRLKHPVKKDDLNKPKTNFPNLIKNITAVKPNQVWCADFTYIKYKDRFIYLATIEDILTREIVGANIARFHTKELVLGALENALKDYPVPEVIHSDQGSEYDSQAYTQFAEKLGIAVSMSAKSSPWENGYKESFYSHFKLECGDLNRFDDIARLIEYIWGQLWYHNNVRIHTKLKTSPRSYRDSYYRKLGT
jgi:putative transposase